MLSLNYLTSLQSMHIQLFISMLQMTSETYFHFRIHIIYVYMSYMFIFYMEARTIDPVLNKFLNLFLRLEPATYSSLHILKI